MLLQLFLRLRYLVVVDVVLVVGAAPARSICSVHNFIHLIFSCHFGKPTLVFEDIIEVIAPVVVVN